MDNRRGLGKGIRALIPGSEREMATAPVREIAVEKIRPNPYQPRKYFDSSKLSELAESIKRHGVLQPIVVRENNGNFELIAGERRFEAAKQAGLTAVPAVVRVCNNEESLEIALVENVQREDISPLEAANAYRRLSEEFDLSQEEIAQRVGKSRSAIANTLRLLNLPIEIQQSLSSGEITEGHARAFLALTDPDDLRRIWQVTVQEQFSVRETEKLVRETLNSEQPAAKVRVPRNRGESGPSRSKDPNLLQIESDLRRMLGTRVEIRQSDHKGAILIEFYSEEDLERILGLITQ